MLSPWDFVQALKEHHSHNLQNKLFLPGMIFCLILITPFFLFNIRLLLEGNSSQVFMLAVTGGMLYFSASMIYIRLFGGASEYENFPDELKDNTRYTFTSKGYEISHAKGFLQKDWGDVAKVVETEHNLLLYLKKSPLQIIPKRGFVNATEIKAVREMISSSLGVNAKLKLD